MSSDLESKPSPGTRPGGRSGARVRACAPIPVQAPRGPYEHWGKRAIDVVASLLALVLLSPVMALIALAIKLDSRGPVLYRSARVGVGGGIFGFFKFRSMVVGAEGMLDQLRHLNEVDGPVFKISRDPRITRVGFWLRRTSLDELPQFWNVLRGEMSLVGPRPPIPSEVEKYQEWQLRRLSVSPGISCLWQVSGRSALRFEDWMRLDMEYIDRLSLRTDLTILLRTIPAVLSRKGAY